MTEKKYDIIVFGATSFVGQILCRYMLDEYGLQRDVRWAAAGRSQAKLESVRSSLGSGARELPLIVADALSEPDMTELCKQTRLVISTVGPYALYGEALVKACAETGTDYVDLTGEAQWVRKMIYAYEPRARETGARIVPSCGFDSIPSDMGVWHLQSNARARFGQNCTQVAMRVKAAKGGASGGTIASMLNLVEEASKDSQLRKELTDPYSLCPPGTPRNKAQRSIQTAQKDPIAGTWVAPFVMAAINERVVMRSNALAPYADGFTYNEAVMTRPGFGGAVAANAMVAGMGAFMLAAALPPTRAALERFVLPSPGEGPSPEAQENGYYDLRFFGTTKDGQTIRTKVTGDRDPGYGSTAKMLAEAGICLALEVSKDERRGGFWTTATAFDERLVNRLTRNAGLGFEVLG